MIFGLIFLFVIVCINAVEAEEFKKNISINENGSRGNISAVEDHDEDLSIEEILELIDFTFFGSTFLKFLLYFF